MKKWMSLFLHKLLFYLGFIWIWRILHRNCIIILQLHGVMDEDGSQQWIPLRPRISTKQLEQTLLILKKYYNFISLKDAVDILTKKRPPKSFCLIITFDDGYRNNITHALPVLKKYKIPATIFLSTGAIENREPFWFDRLDYAFQQIDDYSLELSVGKDKKIVVNTKSRDSQFLSFKQYRELIKIECIDDTDMRNDIAYVTEFLEHISGKKYENIFENDDWGGILTWDEINNVDGELITFGSHTVDHVRIGKVDRKIALEQLVHSKEMIESNTGKPCYFFCYPSGNFNHNVSILAKGCGYKAATTTVFGTNRIGHDPLKLKRIPFPVEKSELDILYSTCGISSVFSPVRKILFGVL